MDKIKQNIDLQEAIQRYNIEKSVVGTLAYNIDQNLQKGMSPDEAIENVLQKSKSMPIGTIHNGFKKIAEGKWRKVSTSEMTKEEHEAQASHHNEQRVKNPSEKDGKGSWHLSQENSHKRVASNLDSKDYSDEEVTGGEKKEDIKEIYSLIDKLTPGEKFEILAESGNRPTSGSRYFYSDEDKGTDRVYKMKGDLSNEELISRINHKINQRDRVQKLPFKKSQPESTLSKSEQTEAQKAKVKKVMDEWKAGKLKSSSGEKVTSQSQALAIAMSEAGIEMKKSEDSDIEKGGEGSRGGKVIGHTRSGKPIYDVTGYKSSPKEGAHPDEHVWTGKGREKHKEDHKDFTKEDHEDAIEIHKNKRHEYARYVPKYGHHHSSTQLGAKETIKFHKHSDAILSHKSQLENL